MKTLFSIGDFDTFKAAHLEKFPNEAIIFKTIEKHFGKFFSFENDCIIYGGFCRRIIGGESLVGADIDLNGFYYLDQSGLPYDELDKFWMKLEENRMESERYYLSDYRDKTQRVYKLDTLKFKLYSYDGMDLSRQISWADFTNSRLITDFKKMYVFDAQDVEDIRNKILRPNKSGKGHARTRKERIKKFTDMGWSMSPELVNVLTESMKETSGSSYLSDIKPKTKKKTLHNAYRLDAAPAEPNYYVAPPVRNDDIFAVGLDEVAGHAHYAVPEPADPVPPAQPEQAVQWPEYDAPAGRYAVQAEAAQYAVNRLARRYQAEAYRREQQAQANIRGPRQRG